MTNNPKPLSADAKVQCAVGQLIEYLARDEWKHWEESGKPRNHIWHAVKVANFWLSQNER